jgi:acid phosphatase type 7
VDCGPLRCPTFRGSSGYYDYFGSRAGPRGKGYYSYNLGNWHLVVLNSMCRYAGGCETGSPQEQWLRSDLQANSDKRCILAYWHHPLFSSGQSRSYTSYYDAFWRALHAKGADAVLVGHDHVYERFGRQDEDGRPTRRVNGHLGPREFMVGTGGKNIGKFVTRRPNSLVRIQAHGVLRLRLRQDSYEWRFVRIDGRSLDSGSSSCAANLTQSSAAEIKRAGRHPS